MRSYPSDPVLIKPSTQEFLRKWNGLSESCETISNIHLTMRGLDKLNDDMSEAERYRYEKKLRRKAKRRHSIIVANRKIIDNDMLHRSNSAPDLHNLDGPTCSKRVSFSLASQQEHLIPRDYVQNTRPSVSHVPRPILIRKNRAVSLPLNHMDFDAFVAFRRGSKMRTEAMDPIYTPPQDKKRVKSSWYNPSCYLKAIFNCFNSKRNRTSPHSMDVFVITPNV